MPRRPLYSPPSGAGATPYLASLSSFTPDLDPSSLLADGRMSGEYIELDLQSPAATPLPTDGVVFELSLYDLLGTLVPSFDILDPWYLELSTDGLIPDDAYVCAGVSDGAVAAGARAVGCQMRGNAGTSNDGARLYNAGAGWAAVAITGSAAVRRASPFLGPSDLSGTTFRLRSHGTALYEDDGTIVDIDSGSVINGAGDYDRLFVGAGWVAGTGGPTATVRLRASLTLLPRATIRTLE